MVGEVGYFVVVMCVVGWGDVWVEGEVVVFCFGLVY